MKFDIAMFVLCFCYISVTFMLQFYCNPVIIPLECNFYVIFILTILYYIIVMLLEIIM